MAFAGSSHSVTSLAKPERKGVYGCGWEAEALRRGSRSSAASALGASEGERLAGVFHSLTLPWLSRRLGSGTRRMRLFSRGDLPIGLMTKAAAVLKTGVISCFFLSFLLNTWLGQRSAAFSAAFLTWERVQLVLSSLALSLSICAGVSWSAGVLLPGLSSGRCSGVDGEARPHLGRRDRYMG